MRRHQSAISLSDSLHTVHTHTMFVSGSVGKLIRRTEFLVMEDATLIWFWVLSLLLMNYKWQRGKWRTPAVTVCQPRSVSYFFWVGNFFSSPHFTPLLWLPSSLPPPFPFLSFASGWVEGESQGSPLSRPREPQRKGFRRGWCRRPLDRAFRCDNCDAEQTTSANPAGAGAGLCAGRSLASRQTGEKGT